MRRLTFTGKKGYLLMSMPEEKRAEFVKTLFHNAETLSTENRGWDINMSNQHWSA
jgi:hypothetical protein